MFKNVDYQRLHCVSIRELNQICLKLVKFAYFQFVVLERRQPIFVLRIEIPLNFAAFKVIEFLESRFLVVQGKNAGNTLCISEYFNIAKAKIRL